jgi:antitoxin component YwqK of YwqJK toxin-antitoxin module
MLFGIYYITTLAYLRHCLKIHIMQMRSLTLLTTILLAAACSPQKQPNLEINADLAAVVSLAVDIASVQDRNGKAYLPNHAEPFSGWTKCDHENGQVHLMMRFTEGHLTRVARWQPNGMINFDIVFDLQDGTELEGMLEKLVNFASDYDEEDHAMIFELPFEYSEDGLGFRVGANLTWWNGNGQREFTRIAVDGFWDGEHSFWHENGQLLATKRYKNGKRDGEALFYYQNGQFASRQIYQDGKLVEIKEHFLFNGEKCARTTFSDGNGLIVAYSLVDGSLSSETPYVNGERHGLGKWYYSDGSLKQKTPFVNGEMHGVGKSYYSDGSLSSETPFVNGEMHGVGKSYYSDGSIMYETPYVNGERHGVLKRYREDGSIMYTIYYVDGVRLD